MTRAEMPAHAALAVLLIATMTACGSAHTSGAAPSASLANVPQDLASKIGCTDYKDDTQPELFSFSEGNCTLPSGGFIQILSFKANQDQWQQAVKGQDVVIGKGWAVEVDTVSDASTVIKAIGGKPL
jgi:hypothetical protein